MAAVVRLTGVSQAGGRLAGHGARIAWAWAYKESLLNGLVYGAVIRD